MFPETRLSLIAALKEPDNKQAQERFAEMYAMAIRQWCLAKANDWDPRDADDLASEVMTLLLEKIQEKMKSYDQSRQEEGNYGTWLRTVARNVLIDLLRKKSPDKAAGGSAFFEMLQQQPDDSSLEDAREAKDRYEVMRDHVLPKLREKFGDRWAAIEAIGLEDGRAEGRGNAAEVAKQHGLSLSNLYKIRCEARTMARQIFDKLDSDGTI
jgi:DNA-directed RNA polymerase specialized sigma24 family protein